MRRGRGGGGEEGNDDQEPTKLQMYRYHAVLDVFIVALYMLNSHFFDFLDFLA